MANTAFIDGNSASKTATANTAADGSQQAIVSTNSRRNGGTLHRNAVTAADKLSNPSALGSATGETVSGGSLVSATGYYYTVLWRTIFGTTTVPTITGATTPGSSNNALRLALGSPPAGAIAADIFLSTTSTGPAWVCSVTPTQLTTSGCLCVAVGTVTTTGRAPANSIDIGIVGNGLASSNPLYTTYNTAYQTASQQSITPISCAGYSRAHLLIELSITDWRALPALTIVPFFNNQTQTSDYHAGSAWSMTINTNAGNTLWVDVEIDVDGSTDFYVEIDNIAGQGAAASIWVELM